ncbi:MAG TPA: thymidine phosphorylase [Pyrinomonadaceae bacterium]|nr:thymidine phosphorylase [Pyrinomonadaceae bacterium]
MRPQDIIAKKRDGVELTAEEIAAFVEGVCDKSWADYQISALLMAMFIRGLNENEGGELVRSMLYSGEVLDLSDIDKPKADKHSTGGVGDKTSLIIAPLVAACGIAVPMISGRGLGHTGGTLDKLESIPGYNVSLSTEEFRGIVKKCGFAMAGQTAEIAPADKKLYALRDATATVPYVPLIVASIMSKKLAEGLDALILDVKTGSGAFMPAFEDSKTLAESLVRTGNDFGVRTEAVITDMSQPLGRFVGNALETYECIQILKGVSDEAWAATKELSVELAARLLVLAGISGGTEEARDLANSKLADGSAFEKFRENVECQGGDPSVCDEPQELLGPNLEKFEVLAEANGFITAIDTLAIGNAVCEIGGGRTKAEDKVDHAVGYESLSRIGDSISNGSPLGVLHCRSRAQADSLAARIKDAHAVSEVPIPGTPLVVEVISTSGN